VSGSGVIEGNLVDDGVVEAKGGTLIIDGSVSGSGTIEIGDGATVEITGAVSAGTRIVFETRNGTLQLDSPQSFQGTIAAATYGDVIDLPGVIAAATDTVDGQAVDVVTKSGDQIKLPLGNSLPPGEFSILDDDVELIYGSTQQHANVYIGYGQS